MINAQDVWTARAAGKRAHENAGKKPLSVLIQDGEGGWAEVANQDPSCTWDEDFDWEEYYGWGLDERLAR